MKKRRIFTAINMILKMLVRRKIVLILIATIPVVFLSVVEFTTSDRILPFKLASLSEEILIEVSQRGISLVFFAVASAGFLVSFLSLNLIQKNIDANKRLVICGYHPVELLISNLISLFFLIIFIAVYVGFLTNLYFPVDHLAMFIYSLVLIGLVYGCYGLMIGSLIDGELEGILFIVLIVNIDVGWLQNPLFYAEAQNKEFITYLPAYYPSQSSIISAFTDYSMSKSSLYSWVYGLIFLLMSVIIFYNKMKLKQ